MNNQKRVNEGALNGPPAKLKTTSKIVNKIRQIVDAATINTVNNVNTQPSVSNVIQSMNTASTTETTSINNPDPSFSVSMPTTAIINTNRDPSTLSPQSHASLTSPTFTVNNLLHGVDNNAMPQSFSGTTKREPNATTNQPSTSNQSNDKRIDRNQQLKNKGRISVSLRGTSVYTEAEMWCILHTLRARKASKVDSNLYTAELLTGTYTHAEDVYGRFKMNENVTYEDIGSVLDQSTQVCEKEIEAAYPKPTIDQTLKPVPELVENKEIIPSGSKPIDIVFNQRAFINYTKHAIPEDVAVVMSMGPKFAVPVYNSDDDFDTLKGTAYVLNEIYGHVEGKAEVRNNIDKHIKEYRQNQKAYRTDQKDYFHQAIQTTTQFIKQHPDVIAVQSDKARASILMDKEVYITKVENLLSDKTTYQWLKTSATRGYMKMNENLLKRMVKLKMATEREMSAAISHECQPANLYGLLKNHKKDKPMRPIVNTRNSMGFLLAEKATEILTTARDTGMRYNVLNSRMACDRIRQAYILPDEQLVSLDIVSMFTNITTDRAINSVKKRQKQLSIDNEKMKLIIDIIKFVCIQSTEIRFNNEIYKQIKGLRMGSSLSPILADFVVEDMLDSSFTTIERPRMLMKYVDDLLCILEVSETNKILEALNDCDPHIKFEIEKEQEGKINYLDITVHRVEGELKTKWYQKHISSGQFLNYHSNHPRTTIWNTAIQYAVTMILNTHPDYYEEILETAMDRLTRNSYPVNTARKIINEAKRKIADKEISLDEHQTQGKANDVRYTLSIEYIPKLTEKIQRDIIDSHKKNGSDENIQIPATPMHTMSKKVFNKHKNSNAQFDITEHDISSQIDLTQNNE